MGTSFPYVFGVSILYVSLQSQPPNFHNGNKFSILSYNSSFVLTRKVNPSDIFLGSNDFRTTSCLFFQSRDLLLWSASSQRRGIQHSSASVLPEWRKFWNCRFSIFLTLSPSARFSLPSGVSTSARCLNFSLLRTIPFCRFDRVGWFCLSEPIHSVFLKDTLDQSLQLFFCSILICLTAVWRLPSNQTTKPVFWWPTVTPFCRSSSSYFHSLMTFSSTQLNKIWDRASASLRPVFISNNCSARRKLTWEYVYVSQVKYEYGVFCLCSKKYLRVFLFLLKSTSCYRDSTCYCCYCYFHYFVLTIQLP